MANVENVSVEKREAAPDEADGKRETQRLIVPIIYKRGPSASMIVEWLDTPEQTSYRLFDIFDAQYSRRHLQRLLKTAGLTNRSLRGIPPLRSTKFPRAAQDEFGEKIHVSLNI